MECPINKKGAEIVIDYCAGALDERVNADFEKHLIDCVPCSRLVDAQREVWETLDHWTPPQVSQNFDAKLYAKIAQENSSPAWLRAIRRFFQPAVPIAAWKPAVSLAAACAMLAVGLVVRTPHAADNGPQMRVEHVDLEQVQSALDDLDVLMPPSANSGAM
jgi:hypothetical protein